MISCLRMNKVFDLSFIFILFFIFSFSYLFIPFFILFYLFIPFFLFFYFIFFNFSSLFFSFFSFMIQQLESDSRPLKKKRTLKKNESLSIFISPKIDRARQTLLKNEVTAPLVVEDDGSESSTATEKETSELETESDMEVHFFYFLSIFIEFLFSSSFCLPFFLLSCSFFILCPESRAFLWLFVLQRTGTRSLESRRQCTHHSLEN